MEPRHTDLNVTDINRCGSVDLFETAPDGVPLSGAEGYSIVIERHQEEAA